MFFTLSWELLSNNPSLLYIHLPVSHDYAKILSVKLSKKPDKNFISESYSYARFKTHGNFKVEAKIDFKVKRISKYKEKINPKVFLKDEPGLLMNKTKNLCKDLGTACEVYDWIVKNVGFTENTSVYFKDLTEPNLVDLKRALKGKAMCGGKSALFVSMCRNLGIPARVVTGYFLQPGWTLLHNTRMHSKWLDLHVWAEFYKNGYWHPVDINISQQSGKKYFSTFPDKIFGKLDRRIVVSIGSSFKLNNIKLDYLQSATFSKGKNLKLELIY